MTPLCLLFLEKDSDWAKTFRSLTIVLHLYNRSFWLVSSLQLGDFDFNFLFIAGLAFVLKLGQAQAL